MAWNPKIFALRANFLQKSWNFVKIAQIFLNLRHFCPKSLLILDKIDFFSEGTYFPPYLEGTYLPPPSSAEGTYFPPLLKFEPNRWVSQVVCSLYCISLLMMDGVLCSEVDLTPQPAHSSFGTASFCDQPLFLCPPTTFFALFGEIRWRIEFFFC